MIGESRWDGAAQPPVEEQPHWFLRFVYWLIERLRPDLGWPVLATCLLLAMLPAWALGENRVTELRRIQAGVDAVGPLAVLITWLLLGWRQRRSLRPQRVIRVVLLIVTLLLLGLLVLSQALIDWLPDPVTLGRTLFSNNWGALGQQMASDWAGLFTRFGIWWQGVQTGGAAQDNLIFATVAGAAFWIFGVILAWITRFTRRGLLAAGPLLWLLGTVSLYTDLSRSVMLSGVALAVILHILLDQHTLEQRWQRQRIDYSGGLFVDRLLIAVGAGVAIILVAALMPNLYSTPVVVRYYRLIEPFDAWTQAWRDRLFPELEGVSRRGQGGAGGLPNAFLIGGGSELGEALVMSVRTDDSADYAYEPGAPPFEQVEPPGHYMRGGTLTVYNGRGWRNPDRLRRQDHPANERWQTSELKGRKLLLQTVTLEVSASVLYAAPEALEPGVDYEAEVRADGDLVAIWQRARNYSIVSAIPAVSEANLMAAPSWGPDLPLPADYTIHLELPNTITDRTRQLAQELTVDQPTMYAKARAIETYLRQFEYDLSVSKPPNDVKDVADYFLFDLKRGYCDYYTTAFVVLARLAGLPTRFATGYAVGRWNEVETIWLVTEGEAHSWPEVYFPDYGWIPFEPTAGRPELVRIGLPETGDFRPSIPAATTSAVEETPPLTWNWQSLFWLIPIALVAWGGFWLGRRWLNRREDPWLGLLRWGRRLGRPLNDGETVLEYGNGLADYIVQQQTQTPDAGRVAAREVTSLSSQVNLVRYGPDLSRPTALSQADEHWARLRGYLPGLNLRRARSSGRG